MLETSDEFREESAPKVATGLAVILVVAFGLYVLYYAKTHSKTALGHLDSSNIEEFLTARKSVPWFYIAWSFYASAVGSWVITGPPQFGFYGGVLGVVSYAFASSMPILLISTFGPMMHKQFPKLLSLSDFSFSRFGRKTQVLVVLVTILNMSITAIAEYTTLTSLYSDFVGLQDYATLIVLLVAVVTLTYTTYGGLKASIITDRAQAVVSLFLVQVITIYLFADFRKSQIEADLQSKGVDTSSAFKFTSDLKGLNKSGYSSLFTLPFSLSTATLFSEAFWQRSWAAVDDKSLRKGAYSAAVLIFIVVGAFGATGLLVAWANLVQDLETFNPNLFCFQVFSREAGKTIVSSGIGVLVLLLGTTMSESAIDSLQTGISASVNGALATLLHKDKLLIGRVVLVLINIPFIAIGLKKYNVLSLFLVGNMACVCAFFPIFLGFLSKDLDKFNLLKYLNDWIPVLNFLSTVFVVMIFSAIYYPKVYGTGESSFEFSEGVKYAFWGNTFYEYEYFLVGLIATVVITLSMLLSLKVYHEKIAKTEVVENSEELGKNEEKGEKEVAISMKEEMEDLENANEEAVEKEEQEQGKEEAVVEEEKKDVGEEEKPVSL